MTPAEFTLALSVLLLTPGPTNTLMALAGAERGWLGAMRLWPFEAAAYALITIPLATAGAGVVGTHGPLRLSITLFAAIWVGYLAVRLWRLPDRALMGPRQNGAVKLFFTTLSNPKGMIIGLVLLPSQAQLPMAVAGFLAILLIVSAIWAALGRLAGSGPTLSPAVRKGCAVWLGLLAVWLATSGFAA